MSQLLTTVTRTPRHSAITQMRGPFLLAVVLALVTAACGKDKTATPTTPTAPAGGAIRVGLWQGTLPSAPAGSGTLSFRVTNSTSMTFLSTRVPTFAVQAGCSSTWDNVVAIGSTRGFSATLTAGNTSLSLAGTFDSDSAATGTISGVCNGSLVLLGQTFRANWVSN